MSRRAMRNTVAVLVVVFFLALLASGAFGFLPPAGWALRYAASKAVQKVLKDGTLRVMMSKSQVAQYAAAMAAMNTVRVTGSNGQVLRFAMSTGITGAALTALAAVAAKNIGYKYQQYNVDEDGLPVEAAGGTCTTGTFYGVDTHNAGYYELCAIDGVPDYTCNSGNHPGGCNCLEMPLLQWQKGATGNISMLLSQSVHPTNPSMCFYGYTWRQKVADPEADVFDPGLPHVSGFLDQYGTPITSEYADIAASNIVNVPWPDDAPEPNQSIIVKPTDTQIQTRFVTLVEDLQQSAEVVETLRESGEIVAIDEPDGTGLTSFYFKSDLDGRTYEQKITDAMAAAIAATIAAENVASEGAFDEVIAAIEEPIAEVVEDVVTSTSTDTGTGVTTTTTTTVTTNPVTGAKTATTTTTQTDGETTTTTKEETDTLPFIPEPSFPLIPPFDTAIDVPEKEDFPFSAWRDLIPFADVLAGTKVEAEGGICCLTISTDLLGSWDLDFCSWDTHLQWLGNFIYIFACFYGVRLVTTGRE